jgi:chromosome partitioning protein
MAVKNIAIINQKGGVGKSTTALAIGAGISAKGCKVLFVDLDTQGNLTYALGEDPSGTGLNSLSVLAGKATAQKSVIETAVGDLIPSAPGLALADATIKSPRKEFRLKDALAGLGRKYDYCIIDTPPALGTLTINALMAAHGCIIPAQADIFSLKGIGQLYATIGAVKKEDRNPSLKVMGILLTRHNPRATLSQNVAKTVGVTAASLDTKLYKTQISECIALKESQAARKSIFEYAPNSRAAQEYMELVAEILKEEKRK